MKILAPLRGVTVRLFRETFSRELVECGFDEAVTPFITATAGYDPLKDDELAAMGGAGSCAPFRITPQFIGKDPAAFRHCLERIRQVGCDTADLNAGCPFPMVRNKGRGSGLLRTPDVLRRMLETGCEVMGPSRFSIKVRLGVERPDELLELMPIVNGFPLRFMTVHARTARQMYSGACDLEAFAQVAAASAVPVVYNGDAALTAREPVMIGRAFVREIGRRRDFQECLSRYVAALRGELRTDSHVLGRLKELASYWKDLPGWAGRWKVAKLARTVDEFCAAVGIDGGSRGGLK